ncbi:MAG: NfeD family protein [Proteobacteria bacterium]|nr:NfeD family protein [Pseudomonadota bacterium]MCH8952126.1 NfeD family protein [Pseudomonadota bacterium]
MLSFDLFAFLDGASPWWWIALAFGLGAIEVVTFTYFMLWLGLAAFTVGIGLAIFPTMPGTSQLLTFALLSVLYTVIGWLVVRRHQPKDGDPGLNRRSAAMVGRQAVVTQAFSAGVGWVEIDGVRWRARLVDADGGPDGGGPGNGGEPPEAGATLSITDADGMTLVVAPAG